MESRGFRTTVREFGTAGAVSFFGCSVGPPTRIAARRPRSWRALIWAMGASMSFLSLASSMTLGAAGHGERHVLELDAEVLGDHLAAREDGDVFEHGLAAVAEARGLHGRDLQAAAQLVDDESGERLALDVLVADDERLAGLDDGLEDRQHRLQRRQLFSWMSR
jgi:hypothetical protein